jgi:hypothetical protein
MQHAHVYNTHMRYYFLLHASYYAACACYVCTLFGREGGEGGTPAGKVPKERGNSVLMTTATVVQCKTGHTRQGRGWIVRCEWVGAVIHTRAGSTFPNCTSNTSSTEADQDINSFRLKGRVKHQDARWGEIEGRGVNMTQAKP